MNLGIGLSLTNFLRVPTVPLEDLDAAIAALFGPTDVGAWYDPSDLTTVFQDAAGTTPANVGDPVGLILDKSQGLELGAEENTNGTFDADTDWTKSGGWVIEDGVAKHLAGSSPGYLYQNQMLTPGRTYRVELDVSGSLGVSDYVQIYGMAGIVGLPGAEGRVSATVVADSTYIRLRAVTPNVTITVDNFSVKELPGNHATQTTSAARPVLQQSGDLYYLDFDGVDDGMIAPIASLTDSMACFVGWSVNDSTGIYIYRNGYENTSNFVGAWAAGSGQAVNTISGAPQFRLNAIDKTYLTRGSLETDINTNASQVFGAESLELATAWPEGIAFGNYSGTYNSKFKMYGMVIREALDSSERDSLETYLAAKSGVTL